MSKDQQRQRQLPFLKPTETRAERVERLLSGEKRITTAARLFDYAKATAIVHSKNDT